MRRSISLLFVLGVLFGFATAADAATVMTPAVAKKYGAGNATQIITVTANTSTSTTATLSAWTKSGTAWKRSFAPIVAHIGRNGVGATHEGMSRTPAGSFTLTQSFGVKTNPGAHLPYHQTNPSDFWISQVGNKYYNQRKSCPSMSASVCGFAAGSPNEHLYYVRPQYNYAVLIDYNTANAPGGIKQGAGSAFFFHVTDGKATAGCVAIEQAQLVTLMKWLKPSAHPRIIIGTK